MQSRLRLGVTDCDAVDDELEVSVAVCVADVVALALLLAVALAEAVAVADALASPSKGRTCTAPVTEKHDPERHAPHCFTLARAFPLQVPVPEHQHHVQ
jgi:hypothetical protein